MRLLLLVPVLALGCKGGDEPTDTGPVLPSDFPTPVEPPDCNAYEYREQTYNCANLDRCDTSPENLTYRLACCECDPALCLVDPGLNCPDDPDGVIPTPQPPPPPPVQHSSCMTCHNGAPLGQPIYAGPGLNNPHAFGNAAYLDCTSCHGGNGTPGATKDQAHVAAPPAMRNDQQLINDQVAYFNFLTVTGVDKFPEWTNTAGETVTGLDWIQFMNPGDTRVVADGRGCGAGGCHAEEHGAWVLRMPLNTQVGFYSATTYTMGMDNYFGNTDYNNTAADYGFRSVYDPNYSAATAGVGQVQELAEFPEYAQFGVTGGQNIYQNNNILAANLDNQVHDGTFANYAVNQVVTGSDLSHLVMEVVAANCGDCHLGSKGANNRYGDFRSSGCTACHMEYSPDGRSRSADPNVNRFEPANPDAIAAPERSHVDSHQIRNVAKILGGGGFVRGVSDRACAGCHQGSNRTVLQYWGIRMDQNADVVNGFQYPANPQTFVTTQFDQRLYDPAVNNNTFNGRNFNQHLLEEDYDGDTLDDTPPDAHYEAGMGCIDCHGSFDMHAGTMDNPATGEAAPVVGIRSHQSQAMGITCESCHGDIDYEPASVPCVDYNGQPAECATDRFGNPLRNVTKVTQNGQSHFKLTSRVTGDVMWVPLTKDTVDAISNKQHPITGNLLYSPNASYAMGRIGVNADADGVGPQQTNPQFNPIGFSHSDVLDCNACHASWINNCIGCHLHVAYNADPANFFFSNTTGERIVINFNAFFSYTSPVMKYLTVGTQGKITQGQPGMKMFFRYQDIQGNFSNVFAFSDRNENGAVPNLNGRNAFPALAHNKIAPHSTRGRPTANYEGLNACNTCHLNVDMLADDFNNDGFTNAQDYAEFITRYLDNNDFAALNAPIDPNNANTQTVYQVLQQVIGQNTGNQLNHPIFVAMNAGLGSALFTFDANGCPSNPLDNNADRFFCDGTPPLVNFNNTNGANIVWDLDRTVERNGVSNSSSSQPFADGSISPYRTGALKPGLSGPLGGVLLERLADPDFGIILDSWIDPNGNAQGDAALYIQ